MSNSLSIPGGATVPSLARQYAEANNELGGGITSGFAVISFRGKVWRIKHKGDEHVIEMDMNGFKQPAPYIDVVIVKAPDHLSKVFYESGYQEGSSAPPDCYSTNGQVPANDSPKKQHANCLSCPHNKFGSRISDNGSKGKRCADAKRLAVLPIDDLDGDVWGGPMLLRTPAASLKALDMLNRMVKQAQVPYFAVVCRISFDVQKAHPEFVVQALRYLTDEEFQHVLKWREDDLTQRILDEVAVAEYESPDVTQAGNGIPGAPPAGATQGGPTLAQRAAASVKPPVQAAPKPVTVEQSGANQAKMAAAPKPAPAPAPAPAPVQAAAPVVEDADYTEVEPNQGETEAVSSTGIADFDNVLDDLLA